MALTASQKQSIESYKYQIEGLKREIQRYRDEKKRVAERTARELKNTTDSKKKEQIPCFFHLYKPCCATQRPPLSSRGCAARP